jgi:hypothetical protein
MPGKKIYELAQEHNLSIPAIKSMLAEAGFTVTSHMAKATPEMIKAVEDKLGSPTVSRETEPRKMVGMLMDDKPVTKTQEVIFFSTSRCHDIAFKKEEYFGNTNKIKEPARSIRFEEFEYRTSDPEEIAFIKNTKSFKVRSTSYPHGKIRIVNENELAKLKAARMPRATEVKSTDEKLTSDISMDQFNPLPETIQ